VTTRRPRGGAEGDPTGPDTHREFAGVAGLDRGRRGRPKLVDSTATGARASAMKRMTAPAIAGDLA
jgi:hypothetical protein